MKWFQVDSDAPHDPRLRAVLREMGPAGIGGLFLLWCYIADHGARRIGWSLDSSGKPIPEQELIENSALDEVNFGKLVSICVSTGHFLKRPWQRRHVIAIPAMYRRADTYAQRQLRRMFEHGSNRVRTKFTYKTRQDKQDKTTHTKRVQVATAVGGDAIGFEEFWSQYPRKKAKTAARKSWAKRKPDRAVLQRILAALAEQKESAQWREQNGRFIPYPATWLNQERWQDEPDQSPGIQQRRQDYASWTCPHAEPHCTERWRCNQRTAIEAMKQSEP